MATRGKGKRLRYTVVLTAIVREPGFEGWFYAYIPALDLTTHGKGLDGALAAARELAEAWIREKRAQHQPIPEEDDRIVAQVDVTDALHAA